jgi:hypothetical protein
MTKCFAQPTVLRTTPRISALAGTIRAPHQLIAPAAKTISIAPDTLGVLKRRQLRTFRRQSDQQLQSSCYGSDDDMPAWMGGA